MNQNVNKGQSLTTRGGPIWRVKVSVYYPIFEDTRIKKIETKQWKFKEILN